MKPNTVQLQIMLKGVPTCDAGTPMVSVQLGKPGHISEPTSPDGAGFVLDVGVKPGRDGRPDFKGAVIQGRPTERFVYLVWTVRVDGHDHAFRRLKLYLCPLERAKWSQPGIDWDDLSTGAVGIVVDTVRPDGTPNCGTAQAIWVPTSAV